MASSVIKPRYIILAVAISFFLVSTMLGINVVLFPVILKTNNISEFYIGISVVADLIAGLIIAPYLHKISKYINIVNLVVILLLIYAILILFIPFFINYAIWLCYMFVIGLLWFCFFTLGNTIVNRYITDKNRSLIISINTTLVCIGITIGSAIVKFFGVNNYFLYVICSIFAVFAALIFMIMLAKIAVNFSDNHNHKFIYFIKKRPEIFLGKIFQEYISVTILAFIVIYGINNGFTPESAALIVSFYALSTIFDILIGYISDRINSMKYLNIVIFFISVIMFLIYYFADQYYIILLLAFTLGTGVGYLYINLNSQLNSYFKAEELVAANSCYSMLGNIGGILAGTITGLLLQYFGNIGIFLPVAFLAICYFVIEIYWKKN